MSQIACTTAKTLQDAIAQSPDWRTAVTDLVAYKVANSEPFSSGEVAADLRTHRPDLRFSVPNLGEFIRDTFYAGDLPCYDDGQGNPVAPVQVPRTTVGKGRTPAGVQVFVYALNQADGDAHDFEVDIPDPRNLGQPSVTANPSPAFNSTAASARRTQSAQPNRARELTAKVWADGRLVIPRTAVDTYLHAASRTLTMGAPVYVEIRSDKVILTLDPTTNGKAYSMWGGQGGGRVACAIGGHPGDEFPITVDREALIVDLT